MVAIALCACLRCPVLTLAMLLPDAQKLGGESDAIQYNQVPIALRESYALSGTDLRCPVRTQTVPQYSSALRGTDAKRTVVPGFRHGQQGTA
eukprot:3155797-Rhodomonas_salina.3